MKIVALVPVKENSSRVPNKNFKAFYNDKSLLRLTLEKLSEIDLLDCVYVFSSNEIDDIHIKNTSALYLSRPLSLDSDQTTGNQIISEFVKLIHADIYVLVHVTAPFLKPESIEEGIQAIINNDNDSAFSVEEKQIFYWVINKQPNYSLDNIPRTQDLSPIYIETTGCYVFKKSVFLEGFRRIGNSPYMIVVNKTEAIDIDVEEDFKLAQVIYSSNSKWKS